MAKNSGGGGWGLLGLVAGILALAWLKTGRDGQDSPFVPNAIEDRLDLLVATLNKEFDHQWVTYGLDFLQARLERMLPPQVTILLNVAFEAEQLSRHRPMTGPQKRQYAAQRARALGA